MRPLLLAVLLALPAAAASPQADWRRADLDGRVRAALAGSGWRLEADGRALDPKTKAPATQEALDKAVLDLRQGARRAALETASLMLASGEPLKLEDRRKVEFLSEDLPPALVAALLGPKPDLAKAKALAAADLTLVAAYFDGSRTPADREAAASPVAAGTPGPRVDLPYFTALEKSVGDKLRASAAAEIGRDPFGRTVLSRLDAGGKPALPALVIEDQNGGVVAQYDFRRGAVVLDREAVLASVTGTVPPRAASALRASLAPPGALLAYLDAHPEAVAAVVKDHDVLLVHELTHAWQDRRDPIFREIARGNLPDVQPLEYEEEAYKTKNLYIHSKLKNDPASVKMDQEFEDYLLMLHGPLSWRLELERTLNNASPSRALTLPSVRDIQSAHRDRAAARSAATADEQKAKSLDLLGLTRAQKELFALETAHARRMEPMTAEIQAMSAGRARLLGTFYLGRAAGAANAVERGVLLDKAAMYAKASRNAILIEEVRKAKERK